MKHLKSNYCNIFYNDINIGKINKSNQKFIYSFQGEKLLLEYIIKKELIQNKEDIHRQKNKYYNKYKKDFLNIPEIKLQLPKNISQMKVYLASFTHGKTLYDLLILYIRGLYNYEYSTKSKGNNSIEVYSKSGKKLSNTHYKKALAIIDKKTGIWKEKGLSIELNHDIVSEIEKKETKFELLYKKQKGYCKLCNKIYGIDNYQIHHKYIPQCIKTINSLWNIELLCNECHSKKHSKWYYFINILISLCKLFRGKKRTI